MNSKNSMVKYVKIIKLLTIYPTDWIVVPRTWESTRIIDDDAAGTISFTLNPCSCTLGKTTVAICKT